MLNFGETIIDKNNPYVYCTSSTHITSWIPNVEDVEIILSPDATIIKDKYYNKKVVVKRCAEDEENRELAVTFGLLKLLGLTPAQVQRMMANAKDYREGKKYEKKDKQI